MREEKVFVVVAVVLLFLGVFIAVGSCSGSGSTYYHIPGTDTHIPGTDTHKSKTAKPKSGWPVPKVTTRKR